MKSKPLEVLLSSQPLAVNGRLYLRDCPMSIVIHHQQPKWVVVEKPAGLAVHNSEKGAHLLELMREQTGVAWHLVHRLDKATSGLLVLAADSHWTHLLQQSLVAAQKQYRAIVRGAASFQVMDWTQPLTNKAEGATTIRNCLWAVGNHWESLKPTVPFQEGPIHPQSAYLFSSH